MPVISISKELGVSFLQLTLLSFPMLLCCWIEEPSCMERVTVRVESRSTSIPSKSINQTMTGVLPKVQKPKADRSRELIWLHSMVL